MYGTCSSTTFVSGLIRKTFNIDRTKKSYSEQQKETFKDQIREKYDSRISIHSDDAIHFEYLTQYISLYDDDLPGNVPGPKTKNDLQIYFGQSAMFGYETVKNESYRKAAGRMIATFMSERAKTPIPSMEGPDLDLEIEAFNGNIKNKRNLQRCESEIQKTPQHPTTEPQHLDLQHPKIRWPNIHPINIF
ncbi:MAG: hypothetical protein R2877_01190 [Bdellovibrionota bacterium]